MDEACTNADYALTLEEIMSNSENELRNHEQASLR